MDQSLGCFMDLAVQYLNSQWLESKIRKYKKRKKCESLLEIMSFQNAIVHRDSLIINLNWPTLSISL